VHSLSAMRQPPVGCRRMPQGARPSTSTAPPPGRLGTFEHVPPGRGSRHPGQRRLLLRDSSHAAGRGAAPTPVSV